MSDFDHILKETLASGRVAKQERAELAKMLAHFSNDRKALSAFRDQAFELAREKLPKEHHITLNWLEIIMKTVLGQTTLPAPTAPVVCFSPGEDCRQEIVSQIRKAEQTIDICVFTITDNAIANPIIDAHRQGKTVRIISDNDKSEDLGSDIERMARAGIAVRMDTTSKHMHHKFAIFDNRRLLTGSYNWTRAAAAENEENLVVLRDDRAVAAFSEEFERLWPSMALYPGS